MARIVTHPAFHLLKPICFLFVEFLIKKASPTLQSIINFLNPLFTDTNIIALKSHSSFTELAVSSFDKCEQSKANKFSFISLFIGRVSFRYPCSKDIYQLHWFCRNVICFMVWTWCSLIRQVAICQRTSFRKPGNYMNLVLWGHLSISH